jgi:mRNA-degrading endonuclease HigB of HigAB toxin-antitoxin module
MVFDCYFFNILSSDFARQAWRNRDVVKDKVGDRYVFNIRGNKYRLIAAVAFQAGLMWVKAVLTHEQYEKGEWKCV